jgi:hypothetical protein
MRHSGTRKRLARAIAASPLPAKKHLPCQLDPLSRGTPDIAARVGSIRQLNAFFLRGEPQLVERSSLDLPHALLSDPHFVADFLER